MDGETYAMENRPRGKARKLFRRPQARAAAQETEERNGLLHSNRSGSRPIRQAFGLIIPRARDRWFKSNPRNQPSAYTEKVTRSILFWIGSQQVPLPRSYILASCVCLTWL